MFLIEAIWHQILTIKTSSWRYFRIILRRTFSHCCSKHYSFILCFESNLRRQKRSFMFRWCVVVLISIFTFNKIIISKCSWQQERLIEFSSPIVQWLWFRNYMLTLYKIEFSGLKKPEHNVGKKSFRNIEIQIYEK